MGTLNRALVVLSLGLLAAMCAGIVRRGKISQSFVFSAYAAAATLFTALILLFPDSFYTPEAFIVKQGIYDSLLFALSLELSFRAFTAFSGIANRVRGFLALAVAGSSLTVFLLTPPNTDYSDMARYQPGITTAGIWCLAFVALLIVWYQIPVPAFTRSIILGYVPYLVIFVVYIDLIGRLGWGVIENLNLLNATAYDTSVGYLAYAAWREDA
ncbi:MAG: hypothetical protein JJE39_02335 [Vicinamibacteria bacterium]|nr:hypothetical protein [Vicinamibacteria bacterium]